MTISCHGCGRQFRVRQDKLPAQGARTRCPRCDEVLIIAPPKAETQPPAILDDDLFELPPADLLATEDDLFALADTDSSASVPETVPAVAENAGDAMDEAEDLGQRPGGLRGWLARLFSHGS